MNPAATYSGSSSNSNNAHRNFKNYHLLPNFVRICTNDGGGVAATEDRGRSRGGVVGAALVFVSLRGHCCCCCFLSWIASCVVSLPCRVVAVVVVIVVVVVVVVFVSLTTYLTSLFAFLLFQEVVL